MFYTACGEDSKGELVANLALATCDYSPKETNFRTCWKLQGKTFEDLEWSKSGALLFNKEPKESILFFGDKNIEIAKSINDDLTKWKRTGKELIGTRKNYFDSYLVEAGPEPKQLSDGNYLFLYNSAQYYDKIPNPKDYKLRYNLGWLILDKNDPTKIISRSENPILTPELDWERCDNRTIGFYRKGLTPNVVFVEGWKQIKDKKDTFLVFYQGCDSFTSSFTLNVEIHSNTKKNK